jgi:Zn finger protein HypA/HybF involved in hydrogenase expression
MHDAVMAVQITAAVKKSAKGKPVKSVTLLLGEYSGFENHDIKGALEAVSGWKVRVEIEKASAKCSCGFTGRPKLLERGHDFCLYECPKCGKVPKLVEGGEIAVKEVVC